MATARTYGATAYLREPIVCRSGLYPELIQLLATRARAWKAIPGLLNWVLNIVKRDYNSLAISLLIQPLATSAKAWEAIPRPPPLRTSQRMLRLMDSASSVLPLVLLHMRPLQYWLKPQVPAHAWCSGRFRAKVDHGCIRALAPQKAPTLYQTGVNMGLVSTRKVVSTYGFNTGWGALCKGRPTSGSW